MIGNTLAVAWKDLQVLFKDKGALALFFLMPLVLAPIMAAPSVMSQKMESTSPDGEPALVVTAYLVNEDAGTYGAQVAEALTGLDMLDITALDSVAEADRRVASGDEPAAIVIPADFSQKIAANEPTEILVIADPTQEHVAGIVTGIVNQAVVEIGILGEIQYGIRAVLDETGALEGADVELRQAVEAQTLGVIWTQVQQMRQNPLVEVKSEGLEGAESDGYWNPFAMFVPSAAVMFAFFLVAYIANALLLEKEQGSFRRLLAAPMHRGTIIAGKMLAYGIVVFLQVVLLFSVGALLFDMPLGNSPLGLFLTTLAVALAATTMALLVGALAKTSKQAGDVGTILGFVLMAVGGCIVPFYQAEGFIAFVSNLTPHAHAMKAYTGLMLDGYNVVQILPSIVVLLGFAVVFFLIATWRFRFET